ncbi:hypothetical protein SAMN02982996_02077 [Lonsdalea quercina]|uniref:Transposase n=1 Tax=Lonsdalea quercina TaxID=71657 RepID=A0A1H4CQY6_9GAMM|nr:hypothetical protein SAMN02982996_02077 [Lonsdalea quercina]
MKNRLFSKGRDILREAPEVKYVFIDKHQVEFSIKAMCWVLRVARSGWYAWQNRRTVTAFVGSSGAAVTAAVHETFWQAKQRYGAPCLADELHAQGYCYNMKSVAASLRLQAQRAKAARRFSPVSYCEHGLPVLENLLEQDFYASGPNQKWSGDIMY